MTYELNLKIEDLTLNACKVLVIRLELIVSQVDQSLLDCIDYSYLHDDGNCIIFNASFDDDSVDKVLELYRLFCEGLFNYENLETCDDYYELITSPRMVCDLHYTGEYNEFDFV